MKNLILAVLMTFSSLAIAGDWTRIPLTVELRVLRDAANEEADNADVNVDVAIENYYLDPNQSSESQVRQMIESSCWGECPPNFRTSRSIRWNGTFPREFRHSYEENLFGRPVADSPMLQELKSVLEGWTREGREIYVIEFGNSDGFWATENGLFFFSKFNTSQEDGDTEAFRFSILYTP